jgi:hypothetical protein
MGDRAVERLVDGVGGGPYTAGAKAARVFDMHRPMPVFVLPRR